jgi:colanic acid biosynthesis glycosyl transferase WcaI
VVTANPGSSLYKLVDSRKIGILVEAENHDALAKGIDFALTGDHQEIHKNARKYAETNLSIDSVLSSYIGTA